jgi:hypothetical protein
VIDVDGNVQPGADEFADIPRDLLNSMFKTMVKTETVDEVFFGE